MTKIEAFQKAKSIASRVGNARDYAFGLDSPSNDKHEFRATFWKMADCPFAPMAVLIHASHGYYGNSSGYSDTSEEFGRYLAAAITEHGRLLADAAVEMAVADAEKARAAAENEARGVLGQTSAA